MKTYKELIIELNKFELAMKTGKLGLKSLKKIHENYEKVKQHLIDEKYAIDADSADKIISGMSQDWFDTIVG